jgi:hypothetical protein
VVLTLFKVLLPWIQRSSLFLLADCFLSVTEDQITILPIYEGSIPLHYASCVPLLFLNKVCVYFFEVNSSPFLSLAGPCVFLFASDCTHSIFSANDDQVTLTCDVALALSSLHSQVCICTSWRRIRSILKFLATCFHSEGFASRE